MYDSNDSGSQFNAISFLVQLLASFFNGTGCGANYGSFGSFALVGSGLIDRAPQWSLLDGRCQLRLPPYPFFVHIKKKFSSMISIN